MNVVETKRLEELALPAANNVEAVVESSGGVNKTRFRVAKKFVVGPATFENAQFIDADLSAMSKAWELEVMGIIGFPTIEQFVVELDQENAILKLYDPGEYPGSASDWMAAELENGQLIVEAEFEGRSGRFTTDTGSAWNGLFYSPTVEKYSLLKNRPSTASSTGGIGAQSPYSQAVLAEFRLWGETYKDLEFGFSTADEGAFASDAFDGHIGAGLLNRYILILDYSNSRYAVKKKAPCANR